ncbi:MAG: VWA domain-containing protein [Chloracidobacterium sp.]|nr:VWA domain-containing protein [Chloracidobacterium sp.]
MKKASLIFIFTFLFSTAAFSQGAKPAQSATPPEDNDVVKISTSMIQIDVSVNDSKGKVIIDLRPEEIEIYENGEKQRITNFSFISSVKTTTETPKVIDKNAIPVPPVALRPENVRRTYALVVDDLSLSFESAYQTRRALKKFVDEQIQEGDLVAIIRTGAGIGALQQFTSDKRILYAAIEKVKWNAQGSGGISAFAPIDATPDTSLQTDLSETLDDAELTTTGTGLTLDDFRTSVFATGTLGALRYIVTGMSELPGRKSVILFSDGFKIFETDANGNQESGPVFDFLQQLVDVANRASVVFYTVDARGLQYTGFTAVDNISDTSPDSMNALSQDRRDELFDTQEGLSFLAEETGGLAIKNNNDLSSGVRRILNDQSYYLIAYEPDSDTFDATKRKFNKLDVKVLRKGATVRYRSGFFNVADRSEKPVSNLPPVAQLETALVSPFAVSGINMRLNALFGNDEKTGSFVRSLLHIDANDLKFTDEKDGTKKAAIDVLAMSFGDNGQIVDQLAKNYSLILKPDAYRKAVAEGIIYQFAFPVKNAGAYQYRVAIRDTQGGKIGSASQFIEVPNLKKNKLTVSSIVLENMTNVSNPLSDTALRRIKAGSLLSYNYFVYNAKLNSAKLPQLQTKIRIFRDGKLILDGVQKPLALRGQTDMRRLRTRGGLAIGDKFMPGDYVLQVVVIDELTKAKQLIATQFVQFEIVG